MAIATALTGMTNVASSGCPKCSFRGDASEPPQMMLTWQLTKLSPSPPSPHLYYLVPYIWTAHFPLSGISPLLSASVAVVVASSLCITALCTVLPFCWLLFLGLPTRCPLVGQPLGEGIYYSCCFSGLHQRIKSQ